MRFDKHIFRAKFEIPDIEMKIHCLVFIFKKGRKIDLKLPSVKNYNIFFTSFGLFKNLTHEAD